MNKIIDAQLEAYKKLDVDDMMQYFHADIEMFHLSTNQRTDAGLDNVRIKYKNFFEKSPNLKFKLINRMMFHEFVVDHESLHGFLNKAESVEALVVYQLEGEKIRRVWIGM